MQVFIPSVLSALRALLKGPRWLLWKVISILFSWKKSQPPPHTPETPANTEQPPHPTITETPLVANLHEDHTSLHSEARDERNRTSEHFQPIENLVSAFECTEPPLPATTIAPSALYSIESTTQVTPHAPVLQPANTLQSPLPATTIAPSTSYSTESTPPATLHTPAFPPANTLQPLLPAITIAPSALYSTESTPPATPHASVFQPANTLPPLPATTIAPSTLYSIASTPPATPHAPVFQPANTLQSPSHATARELMIPHEDHTPRRQRHARGVPLVIDLNEDHASLRIKAERERQKMRKCFQQSKRAKARSKQQLSKKLALDGKAHKANMVRLRKEASEKIFQKNNQGCASDTIDLHRQSVEEAESHFKRKVKEVQDHGQIQTLHVIVGKGKHSKDNIPKIKPKIQALGEILGVTIEADPENDGRLVVTFLVEAVTGKFLATSNVNSCKE